MRLWVAGSLHRQHSVFSFLTFFFKKIQKVAVETALYDILGVLPNASEADIRKAYMKKARLHHPDKNINDPEANEKFQEMAAAYEILNNPESRAAYDAHGIDGFNGRKAPQGADFFEQFFFNPGGPGFKKRGEVVKHPVTLEDLYNGKSVKMDLEKDAICGQCHGSGARKGSTKSRPCSSCEGNGFTFAYSLASSSRVGVSRVQCSLCSGSGHIIREQDRCKKCKGRKKVSQKNRHTIFIEKGMVHEQRIVLAGAADEEPGVPPGDVVFVLQLTPHSSFERSGNDLLTRITITLSEALFGFSRILLTHLDGRGIEVTSPPGKIIQPNDCIVLRGEGMPLYRRPDEKGDLYVVLQIEMPNEEWLRNINRKALEPLLPPKRTDPEPRPKIVDKADFESSDTTDFGNNEEDWIDDDDGDDDGDGDSEGPECQTQ